MDNQVELKKLNKEIEDLENKIKDLKNKKLLLSHSGRIINSKYYYIGDDGDIYNYIEKYDVLDNKMFDIGNYFISKDRAENVSNKIKIYARLKKLSDRYNSIEKNNENLYSIYYNREDDKFEVLPVYAYLDILQITFYNKQSAEKVIEIIGYSDMKKLFI